MDPTAKVPAAGTTGASTNTSTSGAGTGAVTMNAAQTSAKHELKLAKGIRKSARAAATRISNKIKDYLKDASTDLETYEDALVLLLEKEEDLIRIDAKVEALIEDDAEMEMETDAAILCREALSVIKAKIQRIIKKAQASAVISTGPPSSHSGSTTTSGGISLSIIAPQPVIPPNVGANAVGASVNPSNAVASLVNPSNAVGAAVNPSNAVGATVNPSNAVGATVNPSNAVSSPVNSSNALTVNPSVVVPPVNSLNPSPASVNTENHRPKVKLPQLTITTFSGDYSKWNSFWNRFQAAVDSNAQLSKVEKFIYLNSYLSGEALKAIDGFIETTESYDLAVELLKKRFERNDIAVHGHMNKLLDIQPVRDSNNIKALRKLLDTCEVSLRSLKALGVNTAEKASFLCPALLRCLPNEIRTEFCVKKKPQTNGTEWDADELIGFIRDQVESREMSDLLSATPGKIESAGKVENYQDRSKFRFKHTPSASALSMGVQQKSKDSSYCIFCKNNSHKSIHCPNHTLEQKTAEIKGSGRCFVCLRLGHDAKHCVSKYRTCKTCQKRHNYVLCEENPSHMKQRDSVRVTESSVTLAAAPIIAKKDEQILLQTALVKITDPYNNENKCLVRTLLDNGSQISFIKEKIAKQLNLPKVGVSELDVFPFLQEIASERKADVVRVTLENRNDPRNNIEIFAVVLPFLCHVFTEMNGLELENIVKAKGYEVADDVKDSYQRGSEIEVLLGGDYYWLAVSGKIERMGPRLVTLETKFGWCIQGPVKRTKNSLGVGTNQVSTLLIQLGQKRVNDTLKTFFDLESIGIDNRETLESNKNDRTLNTLFEEITFDKNEGRYCVKFPWQISREALPDNYNVAYKRMSGLVKRFEKDPSYYIEYKKVINEWLKNGIIEEVPTNELKLAKPGTYYHPHQGVVRNNVETTTKFRVVLDGSSHAHGVPSLNDCLAAGPNLIPDLMLLLLRFRNNKVAIVADIEKAFLQINLDQADKDSVRILWVAEENGKINPSEFKVLRMNRVPFGVTSSPFLLAGTIKYHVQETKNVPEIVREKVKRDLFVDDFTSGAKNDKQGLEISVGVAKLAEKAGMIFRKWGTNSETLAQLWTEYNEKGEIRLFDHEAQNRERKILGLKWDSVSDTFSFDLSNLIEIGKTLKVTKRQVLSFISQIFDPLGLLSAFTITAKILFQKLWELEKNWDAELPAKLKCEFETWRQDLENLNGIKIPRNYYSKYQGEIKEVELHCFCDSSLKAFSALVYARFTTESGETGVALVTAKTRVAPLKELTLPRLELTGCLLGARLTNHIKEIFSENLKDIYFWTDSMIALGWVTGDTKIWRPYVSNRITEIQKLTPKQNWFHCPGRDNPADLPTRGITASNLANNERWWGGPQWLVEPKTSWPKGGQGESNYETVECERRKIVLAISAKPNIGIQNLIDLSKYSSLNKVLRITSYLLRVMNIAKKSTKVTGPISAQEMSQSELLWVKSVQAIEFASEIRALEGGEKIETSSKIATLRPILNEAGILCVGGRLQESSLTYEEKHPMILTKKQNLTKLLMTRSHTQLFHAGVNDTLTQLRERYWVPAGRQVARSVVNDCILCRKLKAKPGDITTAPLPKDRINESPPFSIIGIDFAGPLITKVNNQDTKSYICLVTCAVTRAIHLELVPSLSTDEFLMAFRRVIARRGIPSVVYTDNAKTFKKANSDLKIIWQNLNSSKLKEFFGTQGISWKFIIERAAWYGGMWERLVRSVKVSIKKIIGRASLTYTELETILNETEALINSRPITFNYNDINEPIPLTPAEFLIGRRLTALPPISLRNEHVPKSRLELTKRLKYREHLMEKIWKRWRHEYLMELRSAHHSKNAKNESDFKIGDVVIICEDKQPRHMWAIGLVTEVILGRDNKIRACVLKTTNGNQIRRAVQQLCNLEIA